MKDWSRSGVPKGSTSDEDKLANLKNWRGHYCARTKQTVLFDYYQPAMAFSLGPQVDKGNLQ